ncbi:MAG: AAA family ATPase [Blastocatellia bacterium]|nr:AAA family ATPase [Blastocatellia bacterium]
MRIIALANQKGGSAKTTTTINLGAALALQKRKVLLIDMDPQGHVAEGLGFEAESIEKDISQVLEQKLTLDEIIFPARPHLDLAPANILLSQAEAMLFTKNRREDRLKNAIRRLSNHYDYILIDCPPSLGILTINALSAAHEVLITMAAEYYALLGVGLLLNTIEDFREDLNPDLKILGVLASRVTRTNHARDVLAHVAENLGDRAHLFATQIKEQVILRDAGAHGKHIFEYAPDSDAAASFAALAKELGKTRGR